MSNPTKGDKVSEAEPDNDSTITIYIDRNAFRVARRAITGRELRELAIPPVGGDYELFQVSVGTEPDLLIHNDEVVELAPQGEFFSAPRMIMAGRVASPSRSE